MFARSSLGLAGLLVSAALLQGCGCNEQEFTPLEWPELTDDYGKWLSADVAPDGRPVIAYYNVSQGALGFAVGDVAADGTARWRHEEIDGYASDEGMDTGDVGQWCSMKVAPDGTVWVSYYANGSLKVAHRKNGLWSTEVADTSTGMAPDAGQWTSLDFDADGRPVVAHHDAGSGVLRVARLLDGTWTAETVAEGEDYDGTDAEGNAVHRDASVGMFAELLVDGDTEYIAYYDAAQRTLNLLEGFAGAYTHTVVDAVEGGDVGAWPSLYKSGDALHIAYQDVGNQDLKLASREGAGRFDVETVDDDDYVGADTEVFARGDGLAILYFDGRNNDMKLATEKDGAWGTQTLGGDGAAVGFFNEQVRVGETIYVASYDYTNKTLFWRVAP